MSWVSSINVTQTRSKTNTKQDVKILSSLDQKMTWETVVKQISQLSSCGQKLFLAEFYNYQLGGAETHGWRRIGVKPYFTAAMKLSGIGVNWRTMISHGGLFETSMVMAIKEGVVKLDKAQTVSVDRYVLATDPAMSVSVTMGEVTDGKGSNGDPSSANSAIGEMFLEKTIDIIADKFFAAVNKFAVGNP